MIDVKFVETDKGLGSYWLVAIRGWKFLYPYKKFTKSEAIKGALKQIKWLDSLERKR